MSAENPNAIGITAVAVTKKNDEGELYLDWLLEGGIAALEQSGVVLLATDGANLTGDDGHGEVYTLPQPAPGWVQDSWRPMESAPKDGTLLRLLVEFDDCAIDDGEGPFATVGQNFLDTTGEDAWQFVGWDWEQDVFVDGIGRPVGWMPMLAAPPQPAAQGEYGDAYQGAREDLAIWKRRALEAEEKLRVYDQRIVGLGVLAMQSTQQLACSAVIPDVAGIGRDSGHPRAVVLYLRKEPNDDDIRAIQEALRGHCQTYMAGAPLLSTAARDVLAERNRQITAEGWTPAHDDEHSEGEMADAAGCYAHAAAGWNTYSARDRWPWSLKWWKPSTPRRDLVKAGALILAEIERLDRAAAKQAEQEQQP
ncbi:hypothetical protein LLE81_00060 [Staphylococcus epidermidis]|nr:hypothetical protein [Staphylococcus epidermidis]